MQKYIYLPSELQSGPEVLQLFVLCQVIQLLVSTTEQNSQSILIWFVV